MSNDEPLILTGEALEDWKAGMAALERVNAAFKRLGFTKPTFFDGSQAVVVERITRLLDAVAEEYPVEHVTGLVSSFLTILVEDSVTANAGMTRFVRRASEAIHDACQTFAVVNLLDVEVAPHVIRGEG